MLPAVVEAMGVLLQLQAVHVQSGDKCRLGEVRRVLLLLRSLPSPLRALYLRFGSQFASPSFSVGSNAARIAFPELQHLSLISAYSSVQREALSKLLHIPHPAGAVLVSCVIRDMRHRKSMGGSVRCSARASTP